MDNQGFFILPQREIKLFAGEKPIFDFLGIPEPSKVHLFYSGDISLGIKSTYENLIDVGSNKALNVASLLSGGFIPSGQFAVQGYQIWKDTEVLEFSLDVTLNMYDSGRNQVVLPALALSKLVVPSKKDDKTLWGQSLIPPGPSLKTFLTQIGVDTSKFPVGEDAIANGIAGSPLHIEIGKFLRLENVIMTKIEPNFSEEVDEDYMPISCTLSIDFRTVEVVTTQMLEQIMQHAKGGSAPAPAITGVEVNSYDRRL